MDNIRLLYIQRLFGLGLFFVPVGILFLLENGLSNTQVLFLAGFFAFMNVIFEVPSGIFADKYGRKTAIVISNVAFFIAALTYALGHEFITFLVAEIFFALGVSLTSGADSAFIYDTLKQQKRAREFKRIYGNYQFITFATLGVYSLFGGFIGEISLRLTFWATLIPISISTTLAIFLKEPKFTKNVEVTHLQHLKESFSYIKKHSQVRFFIIYFMILYGILESMWIMNQPYFNFVNLPVSYFGIIFFCIMFASAIVMKYSYKFEEIFGLRHLLFAMPLVASFVFLTLAVFPSMWLAPLVIIPSAIWGLKMVVIDHYLNKIVKSKHRATVISFKNLSGQLTYSAYAPFLGYVTDLFTITTAYYLSATLLVLDACILYIVLHMKNYLK